MRRRRVASLVGSLLLVVAIVPAARGGTNDADLDVIPGSGNAGITVTAQGSGFPPGLTVQVRWNGWSGPVLATVDTVNQNGVGVFTTNITIPGGANPGAYLVVACVAENWAPACHDLTHEFHQGASTTFTVTPPATTTTTTQAPATTTSTTQPSTTTSAPVATTVPATTTSTTAGTTTTTTTPAIPTDDPVLLSLQGIPRLLRGPDGLFGTFGGPAAGHAFELFIPRCVPPEGATVLDFDTDTVGDFPSSYGIPGLSAHRPIDQLVRVAPAGSISPRQAVHLSRSSQVHHLVYFETPQRYVGLHVGDIAETGLPITLVAYDSSSNVVAVDRIASAHAPADICMLAMADDATIARVSIQEGLGADVYVDRLFFGTAELPYGPAQARGTVEFLRPVDGAELSTRVGQLVLGVIRVPEAFEIDQAILSLPWWDRSRVIHRPTDVHALWVEDGERLYSFVINRVFVPEDASWISLTATGPGVIATGGVEVIGVGMPPLHPEDVANRVDIDPITIEVTQAIRGEVDLIAPGSNISERDDAILVQNKKTVVRGFARLQFPDGFDFLGALPINAELVGTRDGRALPGSPLTPMQPTVNLRVWSDRAAAYHQGKQQTHLSWNFVLPDSWTNPGSIELRLEVNSPALAGHVEEHPDFDGPLNIIGLDDVEFRSKNAPGVNIWLVDYYFKCALADVDGDRMTVREGSGGSPTPSDSFCVGRSEGDTVRAQPTPWHAATAVVESWNMSPFPGPAPAVFDIWEYVFATDGVRDDEIARADRITPGSPQEGFWLGVALRMDLIVGVDGFNTLNALMTSFIRGKAWGSPSFFRTTPNPSTFIHEAAHTMGLRHTGSGHDESFAVDRWGGDHGEIDQRLEIVSAFDTLRMQALPYEGLHDYMSYGGTRWTSHAVWHHVEDAVGSGFARADSRADDDGWRLFWEIWPFDGEPGEPPADDEIVVVSGTFSGDGIDLLPGFHRGTGGILHADGEVLLRVLGPDGSILSESPTLLLEGSDDPDDPTGFTAPLLVRPGAVEVVVLLHGDEVARFPVTPVAPLGPPAAPGAGPGPILIAGEPLEIEWSGDAAPGTTFMVEVTRDGRQWYPIAVGEDPRATIDPGILPFQGPGWRMRVQASTGLSVALSEEVDVEFGASQRPPMILLPADGAVVASNNLIELRAAVSQFSLGEEDRYVWRVEGTQVAEGPAGLTFAGDPGTYLMTLTDPQTGLEASATITVVADRDLDGMADDWELQWGFDPDDPSDAGLDVDGDGVSAFDEFRHGSSPESIDTDGDGYSDDVEILIGTDPADPDSTPGAGFDGLPVPRLVGPEPEEEDREKSGGGPGAIPLLLGAIALAGAGGWWLLRRRGFAVGGPRPNA